MKIFRIAIAGFLIGLFIIVSSTIRWHFLYPDFSQFILSFSIGVSVLLFSYIYNWMKGVDRDMKSIKDRIDSIVSMWIGIEKEDVANRARGIEIE